MSVYLVFSKYQMTFSLFENEPQSILVRKKSLRYKLEEFIYHDIMIRVKTPLQDFME